MKRVLTIADAFGLRLEIKTVLPMAMRGLPVPMAKLRYIAFDASREARRKGIPFGNACDPLGSGVERCMAVLHYARSEKKERDFLLAAGEGIWAKATDVSTDDGMRAVAEQAGLFWPEVREAMDDDAWRDEEKASRERLGEIGLWGVPSFLFADTAMWGQDRDWLLARTIEAMCLGSDGIVV